MPALLAGRRATTHHHHLDELRRVEPRCEVVANRVFVIDPPLYSSAGVTTGIDLMLHRIADICGEALAAQVAQTMVVALRRGPQDPELSPFLAYRNHLHPALHRVQDAVSEAPQDDWSVPRMAQVAHTSSRHLTRLFVEHAGVAPLAYLRRLRLATAQLALALGRQRDPRGRAGGLRFRHAAAPRLAPVRRRGIALAPPARLPRLSGGGGCRACALCDSSYRKIAFVRPGASVPDALLAALHPSRSSSFREPEAMKIAQIAPLYEAVPPRLYGGTERVVAHSPMPWSSQGHEVTLFATADARTRATLVPVRDQAIRLDPAPLKSDLAATCRCCTRSAAGPTSSTSSTSTST